jgi:heme A synthase
MKNKKIYLLSMLLFGIYILNMVIGKISVVVSGKNDPISLDNVSLASILFLSIALLVIGIFKYEEVKI